MSLYNDAVGIYGKYCLLKILEAFLMRCVWLEGVANSLLLFEENKNLRRGFHLYCVFLFSIKPLLVSLLSKNP